MNVSTRRCYAILVAAASLCLVPTGAHAQVYDFATCDPAVTVATACGATTTACCRESTTASSSFLRSTTGDLALVIPMDICHQGGTSGTGTAPSWCSKPTNAGQMMKTYGLVYRLMQNHIPVYWIVNPSKDPMAKGCANPGSCTDVPTDLDMWVMDTATTPPPNAGAALDGSPTGTPIKRWTLSSAGAFAVDPSWTYDKKQFPVRGGGWMIAAADRAKFNKFVRRQAPYTSWAASPSRSCGNGTTCQDFSGIDFFEIQATASVGFTDFTVNPTAADGAVGFLAGRVPIAAKLNYEVPRVAELPGPSGVSQKWLGNANIQDAADSGCASGAFTPSDAVFCDLTSAQISSGALVNGGFGWLWMDHKAPSCGAELAAIRTFLTHQPAVRAAGNVLGIADATSLETSCGSQQLLGNEVAGHGLTITNGSSPDSWIVRYPANLMNQFGNIAPDFASGLGGNGYQYYGGTANGYNPAFRSGANPNSLHRLNTIDRSGTGNTICPYNKSDGEDSVGCDVYASSAAPSGDNLDLSVYGRFQNKPSNGLVYYLPGTQIHNHPAELRMLLNSLLALPLGTVPIALPTTREVTRSNPIIATIDNQDALVQGTYESVDPPPTVTTMSVAANVNTFRFPYLKGHMRAIDTTEVTTSAAEFATQDGSAMFDAADGIPSPSYVGCGASAFKGACRTVFTTTAGGLRPSRVLLESGTVATLGPLMAANLTAAEWPTLIKRILAGHEVSPNYFEPRLGGVDRSTVAVIPASSTVGPLRPTMVYFGAADGMLHAVCASVTGPCDQLGRELWAYIPRKVLPDLRYNLARIDGSPRVLDIFADFDGTGRRSFRTVLMFQTGTGDATAASKTPAVYALDVTDPGNPTVMWEYTMATVTARGPHELGRGLVVAAGKVGALDRYVAIAQTNNLGTAGPGNVVTAIDIVTGAPLWQHGKTFPAPPRGVASDAGVPATGFPGGAVAVDTKGAGNMTDVVFGTLYGEVWVLDAATGLSRDGTDARFRFSTNYHPIGAPPAIYSTGAGSLFAVAVSGGYADPDNSTWAADVSQYAVGISLGVVPDGVVLDETSGAPLVPFVFTFGAGEKAYAQALIVGDRLVLVTDHDDVNLSTYGSDEDDTGKVYRMALGTITATSVVVAGGASSVAASGAALYSSSRETNQRLADESGEAGIDVNPDAALKVRRLLWLRTL